MKSAICLLAASATLTMAGVINRDLEIVTETDIVYFTVTEDATPTPSPTYHGGHHHGQRPSSSAAPVVTVAPPQQPVDQEKPQPSTLAPAPATTAAPVVFVTTQVVQQAPAPTVSVAAPAPVASTPTVDTLATPTDFASTAVYHHNLHRVNNSAPALTWGETYAGYAATVAASCKFAHDLSEGGGGYGQNIAMWASSADAESLGANNAIAQATTNMWYNGEIGLYPQDAYGEANPDFSDFEAWGHYSQVVWVGSQQIGCAAQYCAPGTMEPNMGSWFTVCNYFPAGNMGGEYGKNVLPPLGQGTVTA